MKDPLVSIITPSFNQGQFIEETLKSVASQTYKNYEHIIIDGGSTDNTIKILKKYKKIYPYKIRWISEKDKGQSDAINKGLKMAKGEVLCYLNSDDVFYPYTLKIVTDFFNKNKNAFWVTGDYEVINEKSKRIRSFIPFYKKIWSIFPYKTTLLLCNFINQPSTFWKKEVFKKVGYFNVDYKYNMDFDYWIRIFNKGFKLFVLNKKLSKFRVHSKSIGGSQFDKQFNHMLFLIKKYSNNSFIFWFNFIHYKFITFIYKFI